MRLTRRTMLGGLGATGLAAMAPRTAGAQENADVIVIGAGLSGLYTTWLLEREGMKVILLEATDRVGGRLKTHGMEGDLPLDMGATTVGPYYARIRFMVDEMGLEMINLPRSRPMAYHINGTLVPNRAAWVDSPANRTVGAEKPLPPDVMEWALLSRFNPLKGIEDWYDPAFADYDIPLGVFLRNNGVSDEAIRLIGITTNLESIWSSSALNGLRDITRFSLDQETQQTAERQMFEANDSIPTHIKGGSEALPTAMAAALQTEARLGRPVRSIVQENGGRKVRVRTMNGEDYVADFVVSAMPFHAMRKIALDPAPPPAQAMAVRDTVYSATTQLMFGVKKNFWELDEAEPGLLTDQPLERIFARVSPSGDVVLNVWMNGIGAELGDNVPEGEFVQWVMDEMVRLRPSMEGAVEPLTWYSWGRNPYVGGNRHVYNAGQVTAFANELSRPHGRLHIAGEHTRTLEPGMEAAMASGDRVLQEILEVMEG